MQSDEDVSRFAAAYEKATKLADGSIDSDLPAPEEPEMNPTIPSTQEHVLQSIRRLREGIERFFITDINNPAASAIEQSEIPVLIEWPDQNKPLGGQVLFMDGHVERIAYPGKFPMTEETISTLRALAKLPPIKTK